ADGRAELPLSELPLGRYTIVAEYAGDVLRDPARGELLVDLGKRPVLLGLSVPAQAAHQGELKVGLSLLSQGHGLTAPVVLTIGDQVFPVELRRGFGERRIPLRGLSAARAGRALTVSASYAGDATHSGAAAERDVLLTSQAQVTLELVASTRGPKRVA